MLKITALGRGAPDLEFQVLTYLACNPHGHAYGIRKWLQQKYGLTVAVASIKNVLDRFEDQGLIDGPDEGESREPRKRRDFRINISGERAHRDRMPDAVGLARRLLAAIRLGRRPVSEMRNQVEQGLGRTDLTPS